MTDRPDDAMSSEELIERARRGLSVPGAADSVAGETAGGPEGVDSRAGATATADPIAAPVEASFPKEPIPLAEPVSPFESQGYEPPAPPPTFTDAEESESMLPDGFTPEAPEPKRSRSFNLRWLIGAAVLGFVAFNFFTADTPVEDLSIGDCFQNPEGDEINSVETIDCAEFHDYEVFDLVVLTGPSTFPGDDALFDQAGEACFQPFLDYLDVDIESGRSRGDVCPLRHRCHVRPAPVRRIGSRRLSRPVLCSSGCTDHHLDSSWATSSSSAPAQSVLQQRGPQSTTAPSTG
jgi:hypothetical protein